MQFAHLYKGEIACARREVRPPGSRIVPHPKNTRHIRDPGPRAAQSIARARDPEMLAPEPQPPPRGTSWAPDESSLTLRLLQLRSMAAELKRLEDQLPLAAVQAEMARKGCLQRGGLFGWDVIPDGIGLPGGDPLKGKYRFWTTNLLDLSLYAPYSPAVPKDSNCGWPFYVTGLKGKVAMALAAAAGGRALPAIRRLLIKGAEIVGSHPEPSVMLLSRTGHTDKEMQAYEIRNGWMTTAETVIGVAPRRRHVNAVSTGENLAITEETKGVQAVLQGTEDTPFYATKPALIMRKLMKGKARIIELGLTPLQLEDDISGFDKSVRGHQQRSLSTEFYEPLWGAQKAQEWLDIQWAPMLAPPLDTREGAILYEKPHGGETTSGMISTSMDGSVHNLICACECLASAYSVSNETIARWLKDGRITMLVWGDDTLYVLPKEGFSTERYMKRADEIGYKRKLRPGGSFLGTWYDIWRGVWHGHAMRNYLNTVLREHPAPGPASEVAGLYFRWVPRQSDLDPFAEMVWEALLVPPNPLLEWGVREPSDLTKVMGLPRFQQAVRDELLTSAGYRYMGSLRGSALRGDPGTASYAAWIARTLGLNADEIEGVLPAPELYATDGEEAEVRFFEMADHFAGGPLPAWYQNVSTRVRVSDPYVDPEIDINQGDDADGT